MGRAGAIALLSLILLLPELLPAQSSNRARRPRLRPSTTVLSPRWTLGYTLWNEDTVMLRADGRPYEIASSIRALALGYQIDWMKRKTGWLMEGQFLMGDANSMSRDPSLTYNHANASLFGTSLSLIRHWNFEKPRLFLGMGLTTTWRQLNYSVPDGYSIDRSEKRFLGHAVLDFSFPLAPRFEVFQRFGISVDRNAHLWQIGLRRQ